mmetsp:Transcript_21548/g.62427  ORF Transcript_21548/g.62427 Transcript_21548/m.62427 type:complete len:100 (-) Transcript_21548:48-347(-)
MLDSSVRIVDIGQSAPACIRHACGRFIRSHRGMQYAAFASSTALSFPNQLNHRRTLSASVVCEDPVRKIASDVGDSVTRLIVTIHHAMTSRGCGCFYGW